MNWLISVTASMFSWIENQITVALLFKDIDKKLDERYEEMMKAPSYITNSIMRKYLEERKKHVNSYGELSWLSKLIIYLLNYIKGG